MKKILEIDGMTCAHCAARVKKELEKIEGVESVEVNVEEKKAVVSLNTAIFEVKLKAAVEEAGYEVIKLSE
ncbi:MAG TPA: cation transporter [Halanaerobiales bacterium]|nr:cation transporter [Halanaerobiales bacterium]HPZ62205.1 cation transporter [Halanaerobiales bacterium]HQD04706.1 cation transporter [Halanaerobiales bacterium]